MSQTIVSLYFHVVFSTKHRAPLIKPEIEQELFSYIGGIANNNGAKLLAANGTEDHVHLLISGSKNIALSKLIGEIKRSSSKWIKTKGYRVFRWQDGYGAFSVGQTQVAEVKKYIARQKEKHCRQTFQAEYRGFLNKYEIEFNEEYIWD